MGKKVEKVEVHEEEVLAIVAEEKVEETVSQPGHPTRAFRS